MDFLNLLIPKEKIVGIEISSRKLRMLYLEKDASGRAKAVGRSEEDLESGVIVSGIVKDKDKLNKALVSLKKKFDPRKSLPGFAIVTISQNGVYSDIFEFPQKLANEQLIEAISLNAATNLPLPLSECYLDWQVIESGDGGKKKVLVSLIPKKIADDYISILRSNGFDLVALEPYFLSIARSLEISDDPTIFFNLNDEGIESIIYNKRVPYLSQFESWQELSVKKDAKSISELADIVKIKTKRLTSYFESRYSPMAIKKVLIMGKDSVADKIAESAGGTGVEIKKAESNIKAIKDKEWIPVAGAAARAFIPRSEDTIISLLPVGTESLYETEKAVSFAESIQLLILSLAAFYTVVLAAAFALTSFSLASVDSQLSSRSSIVLPAEYANLDSEAREFNAYVSDLSVLYPKVNKDYSAVLGNLADFNVRGVSLTNISFTDPKGPIAISGVALTRPGLNAFKSQVENSDLFNDAKFSIQNIAQQENIPFTATLYLK